MREETKAKLHKIWDFIWNDDSLASWIVNIILAFILIKFIFYPGIGFLLSTTHPIVAVVSGSMEHDGSFDAWWTIHEDWYEKYNITKIDFDTFRFRNGFNTGDIMILIGSSPEKIKVGDTIVFQSQKKEPIIHRVVKIWQEDNEYYYQTKGDHNIDSINDLMINEKKISESQRIGKAIIRIPYLGYVKILFMKVVQYIVGGF